ncbi:uncharacterized protein K02A2.6-like [Sitodiplosis mosellana]|uniref:uncharacterized protein K02A2.6-like n=1 Tax=Sitodiplosis mosellana TaxID=263140 RepID=UPI0024446C36|nr:uncharacterized protein K02A2.6-like [Sitodiplosis mosellana]
MAAPIVYDGVKKKKQYYKKLCMGLHRDGSLMSIQVFNSLFDRSILRPCTEPFTGYGGDQLNILGKCNTTVVKLPLINDATPIFCKVRPIPMAFREKIEQQLQQLVEQDIITPVNDSDWGTPIVPIPKSDGEIRICGDYKSTINRFLKDFRYPLPRIEEIFASMQRGQLFTKLDLSGAYNQLVLDDDAQKLCTLSTHKGLFRMKRLPFGVKIAASIFQKTMESLLSQFANVFCFQDDIVVTGSNFAEHLSTLRKVLTKLQEAGLRLNVGKCKFFQSKISYLGFDVDKNGLSKNQERTKSVIDSLRLSHIFEDGSDRPVAFVSRALNNAEKNYSTFEKEALAIIFSVTKLRQYLLGNKFILRTDHKPLVTIFGENKGIPVMAAARIQRWALLLSGFNYSIEYVKGALSTSDSLSRLRQPPQSMKRLHT